MKPIVRRSVTNSFKGWKLHFHAPIEALGKLLNLLLIDELMIDLVSRR